jgi:hypothetical protein
MAQLFTNNAATTLASSITSGATSLTVASTTGALFPSPTGGDFFALTLAPAGSESVIEIVYVTARTGDVMTITRGQDGTGAAAWSAADKAELRINAGFLNAAATKTDTQTLTNKTLTNPTLNGFIEGGTTASGTAFSPDFTAGSDFEYTTTGNATITLPTAVAGRSYTITVIYGGTHTVTFAGGTAIKYAAGLIPTATSVTGKYDVYVMKCNRTGTATLVSDGGRNY